MRDRSASIISVVGPGMIEDMLIVRRALDIADLLVHIALHTAAERRIKLREITKLQTLILSKIRSDKAPVSTLLWAHVSRFAEESVYNPLRYFCLNRRRAARPGRRNRLFVDAISDIASDKDSGMLTLGQVPNDQITVGIRFQFAGKRLRVRIVSDCDKHTGHGQDLHLFGSDVAQLDGAHLAFVVRDVSRHNGVPDRFDLFERTGPGPP